MRRGDAVRSGRGRVAHLGFEQCLHVQEFHIRINLYRKVLAPVRDERDLHGYGCKLDPAVDKSR